MELNNTLENTSNTFANIVALCNSLPGNKMSIYIENGFVICRDDNDTIVLTWEKQSGIDVNIVYIDWLKSITA